jgi:hypothetical protein
VEKDNYWKATDESGKTNQESQEPGDVRNFFKISAIAIDGLRKRFTRLDRRQAFNRYRELIQQLDLVFLASKC